MYLKSLELTGFKSFAKKSKLDFTTPITSIVGPNGSGKSNVAEAFRFVLGEQSIKSLRGKRGEDLIFNGGQDAARANRASVKVVFDNSKRFLNIDFDEVSIERVVHRDGTNEYLINDSQARLKDVIELLAGANIGSSGHHIISQGEADRILSANTRERKEMIEDALGLKVYQYKIAESLRKLEKTEENIKEVGLLRREIAPHIKFLKKQVEKIQKTNELREQLKELYREYLKRESLYLEEQEKSTHEAKREPEKRMKELEAELAAAKKTLEESSAKDAESTKLLELERDIRSVEEKKNALSRSLGQIEGEIRSQKNLLEKTVAHNLHATVPLAEVRQVSGEIEKYIQEIEHSEDIGLIRTAVQNIRKILKNFFTNAESGESGEFLRDIKAAIAKLESAYSEKESELKKIQVEEEKLRADFRALQAEIEKEKDSNRDAEKALFRIKAEQNEIQSKLSHLAEIESRLAIEKTAFLEEIKEGSVLIGQSVLEYKNAEISGPLEVDRGLQENRRKEIERIKIRLEDAGIGSSEDILKEHQEASDRDAFLARELEDLEKSAASLEKLIEDLKETLAKEFSSGIAKINKEFQNFFALMFGGGSASLKVVKEVKRKRRDTDLPAETEDEDFIAEEEVEEGIDISVSLPRKRIKGLVMLSGGERALTSIALLFAMSQVKPPPFIILDETDAALDEANSRKYGDMIENLSKHSQLILITHNRETMSRAGVLYGVTMNSSGVSKLLSVAFDEAVAVAK